MSLETELQALQNTVTEHTQAANGLTQTVIDYTERIDEKILQQDNQLTEFKHTHQSQLGLINLLPYHGVFAQVLPQAITFDDLFNPSPALYPYNGSILSQADKYHWNNSTYGGNRAELTQTVIDLLTAQKRTEHHLGTEYYIAKVTAGNLTVSPLVGTLGYLSLSTSIRVTGHYTAMVWIKLIQGDVYCPQGIRIDQQVIEENHYHFTDSQWHHIALLSDSITGYLSHALPLYASPNSEYLLALPAVIPGHYSGLHQHPVPSIT